MLVKHNLSPFYDMSKAGLDYWSKGDKKGYVTDDIIVVESKDYPVYPSVRLKLPIGQDEETISQLTVTNVGEVRIQVKKKTWENAIIIMPGEIKKCVFNTKGNEAIEVETPSKSVAKFKAKASIINLGSKLSEVYLPNINTLPADKQPLLPPEGNYKEIQAL